MGIGGRKVDMDKTEKKNAIAEVAFELFLSNGYSTTKIIDIAKAAGIGKGTVYEYFESKEALLLYLIENRVGPEYRALMDRVASEEGGAEAKLRKYLQVEFEFVGKYGKYMDDMHRQFVEADTEDAEKIGKAVFEIVQMQFGIVFDIVQMGIKEGFFRNTSPKFTATCITSYVSAYLTATFDKKGMQRLGEKAEKFGTDIADSPVAGFERSSAEELLDIILHGIGA